MKNNKPTHLLCLLILIFTSCQQQDRLIGKWERLGDRFKGMQIEVSNEGGSFKAEIVATTDSIEQRGFVKGDIKWKDINKISKNKYEFQDLGKIQIVLSEKFTGDYSLARLEFVSDTLIRTRLFTKGDEDIGTETQWKKVRKEK